MYLDISDVNEAPSFLKSHYYGEIHENGEQDAVVVDYLEATDPDIVRHLIRNLLFIELFINGIHGYTHLIIFIAKAIICDHLCILG